MRFDIVAVGVSLGGLRALETVLAALPEDFPLPIAVAQHRDADAGQMLSAFLQRHVELPIHEAEDKEALLPGCVYLAPAGYHLMVDAGGLSLSTEGAIGRARPSIDVLFESAADAYGARTIGVVLTGANEDGARGAARIRECGGLVVVQDPAAAENDVLPKAAIASTGGGRVLPLSGIGPFLRSLVLQQVDASFVPGRRDETVAPCR